MHRFLGFVCWFFIFEFSQVCCAGVLQKIFADHEFEELSKICKKINPDSVANGDKSKLAHFLWHNNRDFLDCCQIYNFCNSLAFSEIDSDVENQCIKCLRYVLIYLMTKKQIILNVYKHKITEQDADFLEKLDERLLLNKIKEIGTQPDSCCSIL